MASCVGVYASTYVWESLYAAELVFRQNSLLLHENALRSPAVRKGQLSEKLKQSPWMHWRQRDVSYWSRKEHLCNRSTPQGFEPATLCLDRNYVIQTDMLIRGVINVVWFRLRVQLKRNTAVVSHALLCGPQLTNNTSAMRLICLEKAKLFCFKYKGRKGETMQCKYFILRCVTACFFINTLPLEGISCEWCCYFQNIGPRSSRNTASVFHSVLDMRVRIWSYLLASAVLVHQIFHGLNWFV